MAAPRDPHAAEERAPWWPVGTAKFALLTAGTLGLYHLYWMYGNWLRMRERDHVPLSPLWRTCFAPVTAFRMFVRAKADADAARVRAPWTPLWLAVAYFIANLALFVAIPAYLAGPILLFAVLPAQVTMAKVNRAMAPGAPRNDRLTAMNLAVLALGIGATWLIYAQQRQFDALLQEWAP